MIGRRVLLQGVLAFAAMNADAAQSGSDKAPPRPPGPVRHKQLLTIPLEHRVIWFESAESILTRNAAATLDIVSEIYRPHPQAQLTLHGHAEVDELSHELQRSRLARQRAEVTRDYLMARGLESPCHVVPVLPNGMSTAPIKQGSIQPARFVYIQAMPWMY